MYVVPKENAGKQEDGESQCRNALLSGRGEVVSKGRVGCFCVVFVRRRRGWKSGWERAKSRHDWRGTSRNRFRRALSEGRVGRRKAVTTAVVKVDFDGGCQTCGPELDPRAAKIQFTSTGDPRKKVRQLSRPKDKRRPFVARFPTRCRTAVGDGKSRRLVVGGCCPVVKSTPPGINNVPPFAGGDVK